MTRGKKGIFRGGDGYLFLVQLLAVLTIAVWTVTTSYLLLKVSQSLIHPLNSLGESMLNHRYKRTLDWLTLPLWLHMVRITQNHLIHH